MNHLMYEKYLEYPWLKMEAQKMLVFAVVLVHVKEFHVFIYTSVDSHQRV